MAGGFGDFAIMLPLLYFMNQADWTDKNNILLVQVGYAVVQVLTLLVWIYIYYEVNSKKNNTKIKIPTKPSFSNPAESTELEETTIKEYDFSQIKKALTQFLIGVLIVVGIHIKWDMIQPLFMQCAMTPLSVYKNPLFKIFVLGEKGTIEQRPFKEDNPFSSLIPTEPTTAEPTTAEPTTADAEPNTETIEEENQKKEENQKEDQEKNSQLAPKKVSKKKKSNKGKVLNKK